MENASEKNEVNKDDVNVTVKYQTHKAGSWILVILAFVMGIALVVFLKQEGFYKFELIVFSVLFVLTIFVLTAIQMCYVLTAKSIAQSAIQLKIEEEKRKEEEIKKDIEEVNMRMLNVMRRVKKGEECVNLRHHLKNYYTVICKFGNDVINGREKFCREAAREDIDGTRMILGKIELIVTYMNKNSKRLIWPW